MPKTINSQTLENENKRIRACTTMTQAADKLNDNIKTQAMKEAATHITHNPDDDTFSCPEGSPEEIKNDVKSLNEAITAVKAFGEVNTGITQTANVTTVGVPNGAPITPIPDPYQQVWACCT